MLRKTKFTILTDPMNRRHLLHREKHQDGQEAKKQEQGESIRPMLLLVFRETHDKVQFS